MHGKSDQRGVKKNGTILQFTCTQGHTYVVYNIDFNNENKKNFSFLWSVIEIIIDITSKCEDYTLLSENINEEI